jgi:hypothetical protein
MKLRSWLQTDEQRDESSSRFSQFDAPNKENFGHFSRTQNASITLTGNSPISNRTKPDGRQAKE